MAARDVLFIGVFIFVLGAAFFISHFIFNTAIDAMIANPQVNASNGTVTALKGTAGLTEKFDYVTMACFIALAIAMIITGWFVGGEPIYMVLYFIIVIVGVVAGGILSWFWGQFSQASVFGATLASFPLTDNILSNLHIYVAVLGVIGIVVMFAKPAFQGGAYQ